MLRAEQLSVRAPGRGASGDGRARLLLDDVSFTQRAGEVTALLGPNGAGKSTLLRCLSGALAPSTGSVLLAGRPLAQWASCERARRVGVLSQHSTINFPFTALEVVLLGRTPHCGARRPSAHDHRIAREALASVDGEHFADQLFPTLSGGEQQRVQLARVLCQLDERPQPEARTQPRVLLLDEPLSGLDLCHQQASLRLARSFAAAGGAVLVSLHDLNQAAQHAHRVLVLQAGRLQADGPPHAVLTPALIERVFATRTLALHHASLPHPVIAALPDEVPCTEATSSFTLSRPAAVPS